jgi:Heparinase II/III-like protein/Heparinase II/III N-terminus
MSGPGRVRPRPVFCPIEAEHRDLQTAAGVLAGRFRNAGVTLDLPLPPDWRTSGLDDEEWHIEWSKFYFGLDLAHAFSMTGQRPYADAWRSLVSSWIDQCEPASDPTDVTARRLQNWLYAWQQLDRAPGFTGLGEELQDRVLNSMREQLDHVTDDLTPERNHRTLELYALLVVALGLPVLDPDGSRAAHAWEALQVNLLTDVWSDGVHRERSTHYHLIALRSFLAARVNVHRFGGCVPSAYDDRLRAACRFALHVHRPDGQIPALSDSDSGSYLDLLELAAESLGEPEMRFVATQGREGTAPAQRCVGFPAAGYFVQRSGWGGAGAGSFSDERFSVFGCGPLGDGGHGHYDALSLEAYAYGSPLVVDPGRYTYAEGDPNWRRWFKGTAAHNTVTVDGLDQQPYRRGKPKGPQMTSRLLDRRTTDDLDLLHGEVTSPAYDAVHRRAVVLVAGEYWLVFDLMRADGQHDYALRWHLADDAVPEVRIDAGEAARVTTPTVVLEVAGGSETDVEAGWVSVEYGVKHPASVVVTHARAADAGLVTLLAPRRGGNSPRLVRADAEAGEAVIQLPDGGTDHLVWAAADREVVVGDLQVAGQTVWVRADPLGDPQRVVLDRPSSVTWTGTGAGPQWTGQDRWQLWRREPW